MTVQIKMIGSTVPGNEVSIMQEVITKIAQAKLSLCCVGTPPLSIFHLALLLASARQPIMLKPYHERASSWNFLLRIINIIIFIKAGENLYIQSLRYFNYFCKRGCSSVSR